MHIVRSIPAAVAVVGGREALVRVVPNAHRFH